jgi:hypothetical protein
VIISVCAARLKGIYGGTSPPILRKHGENHHRVSSRVPD